MVFKRVYGLLKGLLKGIAIQFVANNHFTIIDITRLYDKTNICPPAEVIIHGLPADARMHAHLFDGHHGEFWLFLPVRLL